MINVIYNLILLNFYTQINNFIKKLCNFKNVETLIEKKVNLCYHVIYN